ncbi:Beta-hydroxyacid dehydrogenase, 3-hydroxyisobutyrate dehydrogenase [Cupriavidus necator]|uniref:NAD(P)-dependent oxidoreductase n=1 Tax=Cupriavidus necator TaxID=106590 RepID=UPI003F73A2D5
METVGIIGIGQLGLPIAINLINAGYRVVGLPRSTHASFSAAGGTALSSPAAVLAEADIVLLCLPGEAAQLDVLDGAQGLLRSGIRDKVFIELSTYRRNFKLEQARRLTEAGHEVLECEVSGSPSMVARRQASLFIGGPQALYQRCHAVLDALAPTHFHLGPFGAALNMKLIANALLAIHTLAAAEALNMGARAGFDPHVVVDAISQSAGASTMFKIRAPMMADRQFSPAPGPFSTLEKYLDLATELVADTGSASPLLSASIPYYRRAIAQGLTDLDISAVITLIEKENSQP